MTASIAGVSKTLALACVVYTDDGKVKEEYRACYADSKLPTLPFTPLHHLPRRILRTKGRCLAGDLKAGRVVAFSTIQQPKLSWWTGGEQR